MNPGNYHAESLGVVAQTGESSDTLVMLSQSAIMKQVSRLVRQLAPTNIFILIAGLTGTGKTLLARLLHQMSLRAQGPFVLLSCASLPETLLEAELFGYARGAFTGAVVACVGRLEAANGGTLFLDDVPEMSPGMQAKLLQFLDSGCFQRLGESRSRRVDVRVISATNRDLREMVSAGRFREDLYYRVCVKEIYLPPLRERKGDIALLAAHFLSGLTKGARTEISPEALAALESYDWPGNVRELKGALESACALAKGTIGLNDLSPNIRDTVILSAAGQDNDGLDPVYREIFEKVATSFPAVLPPTRRCGHAVGFLNAYEAEAKRRSLHPKIIAKWFKQKWGLSRATVHRAAQKTGWGPDHPGRGAIYEKKG